MIKLWKLVSGSNKLRYFLFLTILYETSWGWSCAKLKFGWGWGVGWGGGWGWGWGWGLGWGWGWGRGGQGWAWAYLGIDKYYGFQVYRFTIDTFFCIYPDIFLM